MPNQYQAGTLTVLRDFSLFQCYHVPLDLSAQQPVFAVGLSMVCFNEVTSTAVTSGGR